MLNEVRQRTIEETLTETLRVFPLTYDPHEQFFDLVRSVQQRAVDAGLSFHLAVTTLEVLSAMQRRYPTLHEATLTMLIQRLRTGHEERRCEGLTPAEIRVRALLVETHRAFTALDEQYRDEFHAWTVALGQLQRMVEARPKTRQLQMEQY